MSNKSNPYIFVILVVLALVFVFPFVYLIGGSLKTNQAALTSPATVLPSSPQFSNYVDVTKVINLPS